MSNPIGEVLGDKLQFAAGSVLPFFALIGAVLAIVGLWKLYKRLRERNLHNIACLVQEVRANKQIRPYWDFAKIYRDEGKIKFHLWKYNIRISPVNFEDIEYEQLGKGSFIQFIKSGPDNYHVAKIDLETFNIKPMPNESRLWFVEDWKESERKRTKIPWWNSPITSVLVIGFIIIIAVWVIASKFGDAATAAASINLKLADTQVSTAEMIRDAANYNYRVAQALGMTAGNLTPTVPIG